MDYRMASRASFLFHLFCFILCLPTYSHTHTHLLSLSLRAHLQSEIKPRNQIFFFFF